MGVLDEHIALTSSPFILIVENILSFTNEWFKTKNRIIFQKPNYFWRCWKTTV